MIFPAEGQMLCCVLCIRMQTAVFSCLAIARSMEPHLGIMYWTASAIHNLLYYDVCRLSWSHTKIRNFFRCLWLIDINMLEVLVVNVIVLKVMFFNQHILTNSQLTSIHWPCHCTVHLVMSFIFVIRNGLFDWKRICGGW